MKRSITLKITLWFTAMMLLLSIIVLVVIGVLAQSTVSQDQRQALTQLVEHNMGEVDIDDGELDLDDDFISYQNGVYILLFSTAGDRLTGYAPYDTLLEEPFEDGSVRQVSASGETYYIYDRLVTDEGSQVWIRGIASAQAVASGSSAMFHAALIALPLLIILAAVGGYLLSRRALSPIQRIRQTAEEIGASGDLTKRIETSQNGDELDQLAGTFNQMFDRLEANFEAERRFTADASHELRTPVSIILAQCEYAFENASGELELYEALGAIQKQGYRMQHLIESLLAFVRLEQGAEPPPFSNVDMSGLVQTVCAEQREIPQKNISLSTEIQPGVYLYGNSDLLARLLTNLIQNAYRYGRENGYIHVGLSQNTQETVLWVADNGIGIAPEDLPKIWNRFYRVDKSRSRASGGLGLGLSMVKQIAQLHGGAVFVESTLHGGSVFSVRFPKK